MLYKKGFATIVYQERVKHKHDASSHAHLVNFENLAGEIPMHYNNFMQFFPIFFKIHIRGCIWVKYKSFAPSDMNFQTIRIPKVILT